MAVGLPFILGGIIALFVFQKFDNPSIVWLLLTSMSYGIDTPLAWAWILIRVRRGERLINPYSLQNELCDVALTVERISFGVTLLFLLGQVAFTLTLPRTNFPWFALLVCWAISATFLLIRGLSLQRKLRAWKAVGGNFGMPLRQRQGYGTTEVEEGK